MEVKDAELLKVLQRSHVAAPNPVVAGTKAEDLPSVLPACECKPVWNGEN